MTFNSPESKYSVKIDGKVKTGFFPIFLFCHKDTKILEIQACFLQFGVAIWRKVNQHSYKLFKSAAVFAFAVGMNHFWTNKTTKITSL